MVSIWWLSFWKFWQFLPQGLPKNAWMVMKLCENLKSNKINIIYDNEHYCNKWLFRKATKITFYQPSLIKVNFHWTFIRWRSRHRKNLIANFYDAVNLRFTICKLLFQEKKKSKKVLRFELMVQKTAAWWPFFSNLIIYNNITEVTRR